MTTGTTLLTEAYRPEEKTTAQAAMAKGIDAEIIRHETGWHRGADGLWRYKIPDHDLVLDMAVLTGGATPKRVLGVRAEMKSLRKAIEDLDTSANELIRGLFAQSRAGSLTEARRDELLDAHEKVYSTQKEALTQRLAALEPTDRVVLGDVMKHARLFQAYPQIAGIGVGVDDGLRTGNASYNFSAGSIAGSTSGFIALSRVDEGTMKQLLVHERVGNSQ